MGCVKKQAILLKVSQVSLVKNNISIAEEVALQNTDSFGGISLLLEIVFIPVFLHMVSGSTEEVRKGEGNFHFCFRVSCGCNRK